MCVLDGFGEHCRPAGDRCSWCTIRACAELPAPPSHVVHQNRCSTDNASRRRATQRFSSPCRCLLGLAASLHLRPGPPAALLEPDRAACLVPQARTRSRTTTTPCTSRTRPASTRCALCPAASAPSRRTAPRWACPAMTTWATVRWVLRSQGWYLRGAQLQRWEQDGAGVGAAGGKFLSAGSSGGSWREPVQLAAGRAADGPLRC